MIEIWKDIEMYEGLYQISDLGNVKALARTKKDSLGRIVRTKERILKPSKTRKNNGYKLVMLTKNKSRKGFLVHVLVAKHFVDNPNNYPIVNHKDEVKTHNKSNNLEWCTYKYNTNYGSCREKLSINHSPNGANAVKRPVNQYDRKNNFIDNFESLTDASSKTNISLANIAMCCKNIRKTAGNYIWEYAV